MTNDALWRPTDLRACVDLMLKARGWPTTAEPERLGAMVRALSVSYNEHGVAVQGGGHAARLGFFLARDIPKSAWALRDLVRGGVWARGGEIDLKVLDLGAGMGATTFGLLQCLQAYGIRGRVRATLVDADSVALAIAADLGRRLRWDGIALELSTSVGDAHAYKASSHVDVVLMGQVLSELDQSGAPEDRARVHALSLAQRLQSSVRDSGTLCIVEPALKDRTRHLHAVRDAMLGDGRATVYAPCLHTAPCPALAREEDWCHDDVLVDLPDWLVPTARAAGLRYQGLTLAYLLLRKDGRRLRDAIAGEGVGRATSAVIASKGKTEVVLCGDARSGEQRGRLRLLDRDQTSENAPWLSLKHGDLVRFEGELPERSRLSKKTLVIVQ